MKTQVTLVQVIVVQVIYIAFASKRVTVESKVCIYRAMNANVVAKTTYGPVRGIQRTSIVGEEYLSFRGVPYARPPIGDFRFKVM